MPYKMIYLTAELACMNVKMEFKFDQKDIERDCILESDKITKTEISNVNHCLSGIYGLLIITMKQNLSSSEFRIWNID